MRIGGRFSRSDNTDKLGSDERGFLLLAWRRRQAKSQAKEGSGILFDRRSEKVILLRCWRRIRSFKWKVRRRTCAVDTTSLDLSLSPLIREILLAITSSGVSPPGSPCFPPPIAAIGLDELLLDSSRAVWYGTVRY